MKKALITGITGQTGSYLAEYLLEKGYKVYGTVRHKTFDAFVNIKQILDKITLLSADMTDYCSLESAVKEVMPDEIYNLAAQSFVPLSWKEPFLTSDINAVGVVRLLEVIKKNCPQARLYQASTSEMFGKVQETPQKETTPFYPRSPYGISKVYSHYAVVNYRESYGLFACSGISFNHESPRRGLEFLTRKVTNAVARIKLGKEYNLKLGNMDARRDWGFAGDYVKAMHLILQQNTPQDYVISTGETHSVGEWVKKSFECLNLNYRHYVEQDASLLRPAEVDILLGDNTKIKSLGWEPEVSFDKLIEMMTTYDFLYETKLGR